jgi:hypothetical protein
VKFDAGRFRIAAGYDSLKKDYVVASGVAGTTRTQTRGFGVTAGTTIGTVNANFNVAQGKAKTTTVDALGASTTSTGNKMTTYALNGSKGRFGAGYVHDKTANVGKQDTFYAAYTVPLMGTKDASVTFGANTSKAKYSTSNDTVKYNALRARFNYDF